MDSVLKWMLIIYAIIILLLNIYSAIYTYLKSKDSIHTINQLYILNFLLLFLGTYPINLYYVYEGYMHYTKSIIELLAVIFGIIFLVFYGFYKMCKKCKLIYFGFYNISFVLLMPCLTALNLYYYIVN